jgi:hypothetical protein
MIEEKLEEAGVELATGYRLVMLDMPGIEIGDLTVDVTNRSRLFRNYGFRNLICAVGMPFVKDRVLTREDVEAALSNGGIQTGRVSLKAFDVSIRGTSLKVGRLMPNLRVCVECKHCNRTYHRDELQIVTQRHKFFCKACCDKARKEYSEMSKRERKKRGIRRKPDRTEFRLDRPRNVLRKERPVLSNRQLDELVTAAAIPPQDGGTLRLPRPFVMFEPGTSKVVWEPAADDPVGQQLKERCAMVMRGSTRGQQPIPLEMVIDAYAPKGWEPEPWKKHPPLKVPGVIGVQLLIDHRLAGWAPIDDLKPDPEKQGWWREFPELVEDVSPAREV